MLPPAPARLSTMNCWPKALVSSGASARARMSVVPPAANGTTMRTGLVGQWLCACADSRQSGQRERGQATRRPAATAPVGWMVAGFMASLLRLRVADA